jgi:hypothetical protein
MHKFESGKYTRTRYLSWGVFPQAASSSVLLVGAVPCPTEVRPPLLHGVDPLTGVSLPFLVRLDVLVQQLLNVVGLDPELAYLLGEGAKSSARGRLSCEVWDPTGAGASGLACWGLPCPLIGVCALP